MLIAAESLLVVVICVCACALIITISCALYIRRSKLVKNAEVALVAEPNQTKDETPTLPSTPQPYSNIKLNEQSDNTSARYTEDPSTYSEDFRTYSARKKLLPRQKPSPMREGLSWRKGELLGVGAYGKVYAGLNLSDGCIMAVKKMRLPPVNDPSEATTLRRIETELELMQQLSHPNVVQYLGMQEQENHLYVFLEYMAGGSLIRFVLDSAY